jgi:ATP-dependent RNA helicase DDX52/ROK1
MFFFSCHSFSSTCGCEHAVRKKEKGKAAEAPAARGAGREAHHRATAEELELEENNRLRNLHGIHAKGSEIPAVLGSFEQLAERYGARDYLLKNIAKGGYTEPTPIQMQAIPVMLAKRDLLAAAPTGTGKTAAFVIPILVSLKDPVKGDARALVLAPTRELAGQTQREFARLGAGKKWRCTVLTKNTTSRAAFDEGVKSSHDVIISTPLRLVQLVREGRIRLSSVIHLIFDEADRLFDLGFVDQVDEVIAACTAKGIQRCLFSATLPLPVEDLARTILSDPVRVVIGQRNAANANVKQRLLFVGTEEGKILAVRQILQGGFKPPAMIFVQSIDRAKQLFHELIYDGVNVDMIHGERSQTQRDAVVAKFRAGEVYSSKSQKD